ncbi:MAG: hypothetical protein ACLFNC_00285 [Halodesulfurarchaeum sp.]
MPTRDSRDLRWLLRAGSGVALLLAGLLVVSVGGAGLLTGLFRGAGAPVETAQPAAFAIAGLAPPVVLFVATASVTAETTARRMAGAGATLAIGSAAVSGFAGGVGGLSAGSPPAILLAVGYVAGTLLAVAGLVGGVTGRTPSKRPNAGGVSWEATKERRKRHSSPGVAPADGGSTDSELSFPLDSDDEDATEDERN